MLGSFRSWASGSEFVPGDLSAARFVELQCSLPMEPNGLMMQLKVILDIAVVCAEIPDIDHFMAP